MRRFQEIIDSEDETNGNGSNMQRIHKKKFRTQRDVFGGDDVDVSNSRINFPIAETVNEEQDEDEEFKISSPQNYNATESDDDGTTRAIGRSGNI